MYEELTRHIDKLIKSDLGEWIIDHKKSRKDIVEFPFVKYEREIENITKDIYKFVDVHEELDLIRYREILENNHIEWSLDSMSNKDVEKLDGTCILALLVGAVRSERFSSGTFLNFLKNGSILKWLKRLKDLDEKSL